MRRALSCLLVAFVTIPFTGRAQEGGVVGGVTFGVATPPAGQAPPRDTTKPNTGTSIVRGHVFAADTGQPLRKAIVRIMSGELRENRIATTDVNGQYEFKDLPAGRYQINASKGSFVGLAYGQTRPMQPGTPIELRDNQTVEKVDFALPRGGVITGHVLDEYGEPVADTRVMVLRYQYVQGRRRLTPAGARVATTDDIGEFRLFGLSPGDYYISATVTNAMGLGAGGADTEDRSGYAPTYYPGTPNAAEAQRVTVAVGDTLSDINISLVPARTARISGSAFDADGKPMTRGNVLIMQRVGGGVSASSVASLRPDGTFAISGVAPGEYTVRAMAPPMGPGGTPDIATAPVTVSGEDVIGLRLSVTRPVLVSGRIVVDPVAAQSLKPATIRVSAVPANPDDGMLNMGMTMPGVVKDDFTFEFRTQPGRAFVRASVMGAGWTTRSVRLNGTEIVDDGMDIKAGEDSTGLEIELTNRLSEISGVVNDSRGAPTRDYTVIVFARDAQRWGFASRYVSTGRPDQDGRFKVRGLPAADYLIAAVQSVEPGEASDPEFLEKLRDSATPLTLGDGETKAVDVKLAQHP